MRRASSRTREVAFCGMVTALSVVLLALLSALGIATYAAPVLASILLVAVRRTFGRRDCLLIWAAVSVLALLLVPDREAALLYLCLGGWYPAAQPALDRLPTVLRWVAKLAVFLAAIGAMLLLLGFVMGVWPQETPVMAAALLALGTLTFVLYDRVLRLMERAYAQKLEKRLFPNHPERQE